MRTRPLSRSFSTRAALPLLSVWLVAVSACNVHFSNQVEAKDTWTRSYKVNAGATIELREANGRIRVEAIDGDQVQVQATRVVKASTDEAAKAGLADFKISETASADRVEIDSTTPGLQLTMSHSRRVDYDVKVPRASNLTIKTTNGKVTVQSVAGAVRIEAVNGDISATGLEQGVDVSAVNGRVQLEFAKIGDTGARCKTTNGQIVVTVPANAKATIAARVTNGVIHTENLQMRATEESRRRLDATIGGGGPEIRLETLNGEIRVVGR